MSVRVATATQAIANGRLSHVLSVREEARRHRSDINAVTGALRCLTVVAPVDANAGKRKARSHYGIAKDSSRSVRIVALSRIVASNEELIVEASAATPIGLAFIAALQTIVLRVALSHGGANQGFTALQVQSFFAMACSNVQAKRLYDGQISLPSLLPHARAKALLDTLLETISVVHADPQASALAQKLLAVPALPYDDAAAGLLAHVVAAVEEELTARLTGDGGNGGDGRATRRSTGGGGSSSGGASSSSNGGPSPPSEELIPVAAAVELPSEVDVRFTLGTNARSLLEARLARALLPAEAGRLDELLLEALTILESNGARRAQMVSLPMGNVLMERSGALLWASVVSAMGFDDAASVAGFGTVLVRLAADLEGVVTVAYLGS